MMSLLTYCMNILMSLMMVSMIFVMLTMSYASAKRIAEVLQEKTDLTNPEKPVEEVSNGSIVFKNVDFAYKNGSKPVLKISILISNQVKPLVLSVVLAVPSPVLSI